MCGVTGRVWVIANLSGGHRFASVQVVFVGSTNGIGV